MRRVSFSWVWPLIIGLALGTGGGLWYAWQIDPRVVTDTRPAQLDSDGREAYLIALSMAYARDRDIGRAAERLLEVGADWRMLADTACKLSQTGYISTTSGLIAVRSMVELAGLQGETGCASAQITAFTETPPPTPSAPPPTPTRVPVPTKTPTPTLGPTFTPPSPPQESPTPSGDFVALPIETVCDARAPNLIMVTVRDRDNTGIPGVPVEVIWATDRQTFYTGLKPERDPGYADFEMQPGGAYQVQLPGLSERTRSLEAGPCSARDGSATQYSYRVIFRRAR